MKLQIFCVMDKAVGAFLPPLFFRSKAEAIRSFAQACNDEKSNFYNHSSDYYLAFFGEWDDGSGVFDVGEPVRIISAHEVLEDRNPPVQMPAVNRIPM